MGIQTQHLAVLQRKREGGAGGFDVEENFEGTGTPSGWAVDSGSPDFDQSTAGLSLEGSQCLLIHGNSNQEECYVAFAATDNVYGYFMMRIVDAWPSSRRQFSFANNTTTVCEMGANAGPMQWRIFDTVGSDVGSVVSEDTTYHCWFEREKGTGADEQIRFYFNTTDTKPGSPDCEITNGTGAGQVNRFYFGTWGVGGGNNCFDKVRVSFSTPIGSSPV